MIPNDQAIHSLELMLTVDQPDHVNPYLALSFMCDRFAFLRRLLGSKVPSIALTVQGPSRGMMPHCFLTDPLFSWEPFLTPTFLLEPKEALTHTFLNHSAFHLAYWFE